MTFVSTLFVFLFIIGLGILTGFLSLIGQTAGAIEVGMLTVVVAFLTWMAFIGVREGPG